MIYTRILKLKLDLVFLKMIMIWCRSEISWKGLGVSECSFHGNLIYLLSHEVGNVDLYKCFIDR